MLNEETMDDGTVAWLMNNPANGQNRYRQVGSLGLLFFFSLYLIPCLSFGLISPIPP